MSKFIIYYKLDSGKWDKVKEFDKKTIADKAFIKLRKDNNWLPKSEFRLVQLTRTEQITENCVIKQLKLR
jgi:hypothetical protein